MGRGVVESLRGRDDAAGVVKKVEAGRAIGLGRSLCSLSSDVRAVFETSGFDQLIAIHPSRAEAVAAVATEG